MAMDEECSSAWGAKVWSWWWKRGSDGQPCRGCYQTAILVLVVAGDLPVLCRCFVGALSRSRFLIVLGVATSDDGGMNLWGLAGGCIGGVAKSCGRDE